MHYAVRHLRDLEEEARVEVDRHMRLYKRIRAERLKAEAINGEQPVNGENGNEEDGNDNVIVGPWAAAVVVAGLAGKALFGSTRRTVTTAAATVAATGGIGLAVIQTPHPPPSHGALPGRPPVAAPPGVRSTPKVGPPKTRPPARPVPRRPAADHSPGRRQLGIVEVVRSPVLSGPVVDTTSPAGLPLPTTVPRTPVTRKRCLVDGRPVLPVAALCSRKS